MEATREVKVHLEFKVVAMSSNSNDPQLGCANIIGGDLAGQGRGAGLGIRRLQARARALISFYNRSVSICMEPAEQRASRLYFPCGTKTERGAGDRCVVTLRGRWRRREDWRMREGEERRRQCAREGTGMASVSCFSSLLPSFWIWRVIQTEISLSLPLTVTWWSGGSVWVWIAYCFEPMAPSLFQWLIDRLSIRRCSTNTVHCHSGTRIGIFEFLDPRFSVWLLEFSRLWDQSWLHKSKLNKCRLN